MLLDAHPCNFAIEWDEIAIRGGKGPEVRI
jgi:hypothetical protein